MVEAKIKALRDELERHNYNYYVLSAPTISDFEFDKMMKELQEFAKKFLIKKINRYKKVMCEMTFSFF